MNIVSYKTLTVNENSKWYRLSPSSPLTSWKSQAFSHEQRPLLYSAGSSLCSMKPVFQTYLCIGFGWTNWNIKNKTPALTRGSSGTPFQNRSVPQVFSKSIRAFESADGLIPWWWWELYVTAFFLGAAPCLQTSPTTDISSYRRRAHWHLWTR